MKRHLDKDSLMFFMACLVVLFYLIFVAYPVGYWVCVHILDVPNPIYQMDDTEQKSRFLIWCFGTLTSLIPPALYIIFNWIFPKNQERIE